MKPEPLLAERLTLSMIERQKLEKPRIQKVNTLWGVYSRVDRLHPNYELWHKAAVFCNRKNWGGK